MAEDQTPDRPISPKMTTHRLEKTHPSLPSRWFRTLRQQSGKSIRQGRGRAQQPVRGVFRIARGWRHECLAAQLQNAFAMLGGAGSMFTTGPLSPDPA
jgi:hypothetical protein